MNGYKYYSTDYRKNIIDTFINLFGQGTDLVKDFNTNFDKYNNYVKNVEPNEDTEDMINENLKSFLEGEELENGLYEDFFELCRLVEYDSAGDGPYTQHFAVIRTIVKNEDLNKLFLLNFSVSLVDENEFGDDWEGDIISFDLTNDMLEYIDLYQKEEKDSKERSRIEWLENKKKREEEDKKRKLILNNRKKNLHNELLKNGFTQLKSEKGNDINKYSISLEDLSNGLVVYVKVSSKGYVESLSIDNKYLKQVTKLFCDLLNEKFEDSYSFNTFLPYILDNESFIKQIKDKDYVDMVNYYFNKVREAKRREEERFVSMMNEINRLFN